MLLMGGVFAQTQTKEARSANPSSMSKIHHIAKHSIPSRDVLIYSEGFEDTEEFDLPDQWTSDPDWVWTTINGDDGQVEMVTNGCPPHSGERCMARSWYRAGYDAWAFSEGFTLTEGVGVTIAFWFTAPGYAPFKEYDDFEVRIGQTPTNTEMSTAHLVFENITKRVNIWTLVEHYFLPDASGTYYLGFHDLNLGDEGLWISIDDIEVAECSCCPAMNLALAINDDCTAAKLTWEPPSEDGSFVYKVFRDGDELATLEEEEYTDDDFEPTLEHTWSVRVVCDDEFSMALNVTEDACIIPTCSRARNLKVNYNEDCDAAVLTWDNPIDVLWDNTEGFSYYGIESTRWLKEEFERDIVADDFDVPTDEVWIVSEVYFYGFYETDDDDKHEPPDYFGIEIYEDNGFELPGNRMHEFCFLTPVSGDMGYSFQTVVLPTPVELTEGKYWVAIYGVYDDVNRPEFLYLISLCEVPVGVPFCYLTEEYGTEWELSDDDDYPSLHFRIHGIVDRGQIYYNIYRDGKLIKEGITETTFTDDEFDPLVKHTWSVRVACPEGDEASPIYGKKEACKEVSINENATTSFAIAPNPAYDKITITSETNFSKIEVINFLGQIVISQSNSDNYTSLDVSNLNNGVYFVRITTDNGTSSKKFVKQ